MFHPQRLPDIASFMLVERIAQSEFGVSRETIRHHETAEGGLLLQATLHFPRKFASYRLSWKWRQAT